ncbi:MAG: metallophosphoesterase family protein [Myxococcota bacterium]
MWWWAAVGCHPSGADAPAVDSSDSSVTTAPGVCERVLVPGPLGQVDSGVDATPHEAVFGAARPDPFHVHLGLPTDDPSTSMSFVWRTDPDTLASVVQYGTDGALTEEVAGASFGYGGLPGEPSPDRVHEVRLCDRLTPGTTYSYRVGGEGHWSDTYTFTTPGDSETLRVAFAGDSRGTYETWQQVVAAMDAAQPELVVLSGDMVDFGSSQAEWDAWFEASGDLFARVPVVPAHGNHEFLAVHYLAQFSLPNNELWFGVRYGPLQLVVLNDTVAVPTDITIAQPQHVEPILAGTDARWKIAVHHQSEYATCTVHGSALALRESWSPVWDRTGVDLVFAGHNHLYERSVPIRGEAEAAPGEGTVYVVSGGAGADLYTSTADEWFGAVANPIHHYVIGDFGPDGASFVARDLSGNVIDAFELP